MFFEAVSVQRIVLGLFRTPCMRNLCPSSPLLNLVRAKGASKVEEKSNFLLRRVLRRRLETEAKDKKVPSQIFIQEKRLECLHSFRSLTIHQTCLYQSRYLPNRWQLWFLFSNRRYWTCNYIFITTDFFMCISWPACSEISHHRWRQYEFEQHASPRETVTGYVVLCCFIDKGSNFGTRHIVVERYFSAN